LTSTDVIQVHGGKAKACGNDKPDIIPAGGGK